MYVSTKSFVRPVIDTCVALKNVFGVITGCAILISVVAATIAHVKLDKPPADGA